MTRTFAAVCAAAVLSCATSAQALVLEASGTFLNIDGISTNPMPTSSPDALVGPELTGVSVLFQLADETDVTPGAGAGDVVYSFAAGVGGNAGAYTGLPESAGVSGSHNVAFTDIEVRFDNDSTQIPLAVAEAFGIDGFDGFDLIEINGFHDNGFVEGDGVFRSFSREFSVFLVGEGNFFPENPDDYTAELLSTAPFQAVQLIDFYEDFDLAGNLIESGPESAGLGEATSFSVTQAEVPLPAALPLMGAGLAALGLMARRRRA